MNEAQTQSLEISASQIQLPEQLSTVYTFSVGNYNFWFYGWFALVVAVLAVLLLVGIVLVIRAVVHKHDASATKVERRKAKKQKQEEDKRKAAASKHDVVAEALAAAPPVTAFTPAEYPDGIDPLMWLAEEGIGFGRLRPPLLADRLRAILSADPGREWRSAEAAEMLAVSEPTLRRQLAQNGASFGVLLADVRMSVALGMLQSSDLPVWSRLLFSAEKRLLRPTKKSEF